MKIVTVFLALASGVMAVAQPAVPAASPFIVEPYLQLGDVPRLSEAETVRLLWQAERAGPAISSAIATARPIT